MKTKANILKQFFTDQYAPLNNDRLLPRNHIFITQSRVGSLTFNENEIFYIIRALSKLKAHGHNNVCIKIIKYVTN